MTRILIAALAFLPALAGAPPDEGLAPWGMNHHPTDATKQHKEVIADGSHKYTITQGGTMDGRNCRGRFVPDMSRKKRQSITRPQTAKAGDVAEN